MPIRKSEKRNRIPERKKRIRKHIIADLSVNHVERFALLNGFTVERVIDDYGYDLIVFTFNVDGEFENGNIYIQLKATDKPKELKKKTEVSFQTNKKDLETWYNELFPVILILYDAENDIGYWIYIQQYLRNLINFDLEKLTDNFNIRMPKTNTIDISAFQRFRTYKANTLKTTNDVNTHQ